MEHWKDRQRLVQVDDSHSDSRTAVFPTCLWWNIYCPEINNHHSCRLYKAARFAQWPWNLFVFSGIPQEWWIYHLVACPHLLKALFLALCPSHTLFRPLSRILRMPRLQDKTQSSHQRATESSIQMTNCSQLNPTYIGTRINACIHTDIHTHACLCCVTSRGWHRDQMTSY